MNAFTVLVIGYVVSWLVFFATLRRAQALFGKSAGIFVNYTFSYVIWIVVSFGLTWGAVEA